MVNQPKREFDVTKHNMNTPDTYLSSHHVYDANNFYIANPCVDPVVSHGNQLVAFHGVADYDQDLFFDSFPPGYRFKPYDEELIIYYLKRKIMNEPLPPNRINVVELYKYDPESLAATSKSNGEKEWYFFTPRDRKYPNGERPRRDAGGGYWKATGADKPINFEGNKVGLRKALVFYKGKPPQGKKTDWIMHEYRLHEPPKRKREGPNDKKLDDWVLCRLYKKLDRFRGPNRSRGQAMEDEEQPTENRRIETVEPEQVVMPVMATNYNPGIQMGHVNTNADVVPAYHLNGIETYFSEPLDPIDSYLGNEGLSNDEYFQMCSGGVLTAQTMESIFSQPPRKRRATSNGGLMFPCVSPSKIEEQNVNNSFLIENLLEL